MATRWCSTTWATECRSMRNVPQWSPMSPGRSICNRQLATVTRQHWCCTSNSCMLRAICLRRQCNLRTMLLEIQTSIWRREKYSQVLVPDRYCSILRKYHKVGGLSGPLSIVEELDCLVVAACSLVGIWLGFGRTGVLAGNNQGITHRITTGNEQWKWITGANIITVRVPVNWSAQSRFRRVNSLTQVLFRTNDVSHSNAVDTQWALLRYEWPTQNS